MNDTLSAPTPEIANKAVAIPKRRGNPAWSKGKSGNPTGRPKILKDVQALCRQSTEENVERLRDIARTGEPSESVAAIKLLMAYGYGQPHASLTLDGMKQDLVVVTIGGRVVETDRPTSIPLETV